MTRPGGAYGFLGSGGILLKFSTTLKQNFQFRRLYSKGESAVSSNLVVYCRKNGSQFNRLGITVSAKLGNAVIRNRVRRRLREIYRLNEELLKCGYDIVIVSRHRGMTAEYKVLKDDFLFLAGKLRILR